MPGMDTGTEGLVPKLAAMARIDVPADKAAALERDFGAIVSYIGQLQELSLESAGPVTPLHRNVFRPDEDPTPSGTWTESVTAAFPKRQGDALSVKKIISHD